jgi:hypothetical protein
MLVPTLEQITSGSCRAFVFEIVGVDINLHLNGNYCKLIEITALIIKTMITICYDKDH